MMVLRRFLLCVSACLLFSLLVFEIHMSSMAVLGGHSAAMYLSSNLWLPEIPSIFTDSFATTRNIRDLPVWKHNNPFFRTAIRDPICQGCRVNTEKKHCGSAKVLLPRGNNLSALVLEDLPEDCQECLQCPERDHWYGRFDEAAPPIQQAVSHFLPSVPDEHRFPHNVSSWLEYFRQPGNSYPDKQYFAEYNPSIVRIPQHQIPEAFSDQGVVYLASFRVTTHNFCHPNDEIWLTLLGLNGSWPGEGYHLPVPKEYTSLALLREDLSIVSDAVFFLKAIKITDARLFVLDNEIYISPGDSIYPIWLVPTEKSNSTAGVTEFRPVFESDNGWTTPILLGKRGYCPARNKSDKNLQFFVDPSDGIVVAEQYPGKQKIAMNLSQTCPQSAIGPRPVDVSTPERSFGTVDELHFWDHRVHLYSVLTPERGSACCASIQYQGKDYLLGISHSKFRFRNKVTRHNLPGNVSANHFFSSFYAMQAEPPYKVEALSGKFCLGFGDETEVATQNPYARATTTRKLRLGAEYFDCPAIHFVSGIVDTPDGEHLIIAYGVGDCSPRMLKVRKDDVASLLFPPYNDEAA